MIRLIKWKVKSSNNKDFDPDLKFVKVQVILSKQEGTVGWNCWLDNYLEKDVIRLFTEGKYAGLYNYQEYAEYNPVTLAALLYLEQLKSVQLKKLNTRKDWHAQVEKCIETLHMFWD